MYHQPKLIKDEKLYRGTTNFLKIECTHYHARLAYRN